ncbi:cytochrome P450 [Fodinicola acaciae]|uniref:cytochrome P450 n=1 Tax=Fodinicola acaciae TaxID=2681555 RepID=UPI0013D306E9|nr:cytochrome P450 [Fodinicola acaciae]
MKWDVHPAQFWLRGERPAGPVAYEEQLGMWVVYGHPEAQQALSDPSVFSANIMRLFPQYEDNPFNQGNLLRMDPPKHRKQRMLVSHAFTPKIVADLEPRIAAITDELLDAAMDRGRLELVADVAYPLPVIVIAELLGLPVSDRELFRDWADSLFQQSNEFSMKDETGGSTPEETAKQVKAQDEIFEYLGGRAEEYRKRPGDGLLSQLVHAEIDGDRLSNQEIVTFATILLLAGHVTTTMLLGNTVLCLDANPDKQKLVRDDRAKLPLAIEESLRFLTPFTATYRVTNREVELAGKRIPADQMVRISLGAANRDARVFADPDTYDPTRDPNPHMGFGRGNHFCMGAPLARLEGRVALDILLDRFPVLRTDEANPPTFMPTPEMTGTRTLPLISSRAQ